MSRIHSNSLNLPGRLLLAFGATVLALLALAPAAGASLGFKAFDVTYANEDGSPATQAGSHPFSMTTRVEFAEEEGSLGKISPVDEAKDLIVRLPPGFAAIPSAVPTCPTADFVSRNPLTYLPRCPDSTAIGVAKAAVIAPGIGTIDQPVFNLPTPPGAANKFGFWASNIVPVTIEGAVSQRPPYNVIAKVTNIAQQVKVYGSLLTLWGNPSSPAHDGQRGICAVEGGTCPTNSPEIPFLTLPTSCTGPLRTTYEADSWKEPGSYLSNDEPNLLDPRWSTGFSDTHDNGEPPSPLGTTGCGKLPFHPTITAKPTTLAASSPTGLDFSLDVNDEGFANPAGLANSDIEKTVVTLPEGFSTNPSLAEGLNVCSEADLAREAPNSAPGQGCPDESKIGTVEVETPELQKRSCTAPSTSPSPTKTRREASSPST